MNSLQVPTALYQSIQQKQPLRQGSSLQTQESSTTPTSPPLSDSLAQLKQGFHSMPMPQPTLNASIAQPIQVQIMPPKKTAKVDWKSWAFLGVFVGAVTAPLWWPPLVKKGESSSSSNWLDEITKDIKNVNNPIHKFKILENVETKLLDVIGVKRAKEEIMTFVDMLNNKAKYDAIGSKLPKGVLLHGPSGTGKTLLAQALAGESGLPFISANASEFVNLFVGSGSRAIRQLEKQAEALSLKADQPVIIFIDEIDAIGKSREHSSLSRSDEYAVALNQLLGMMDGADKRNSKHPFIFVAATNMEQVLDPALKRSGRFDSSVKVDLPDEADRLKLFQYYANDKKLADDASSYFDTLARASNDFNPADIDNLMNTAGILAVQNDATSIEIQHLKDALKKIKANKSEEEKKSVLGFH